MYLSFVRKSQVSKMVQIQIIEMNDEIWCNRVHDRRVEVLIGDGGRVADEVGVRRSSSPSNTRQK